METAFQSKRPLEGEVLRACASYAAGGAEAARLRALLAESIDWNCLLQRAEDHRLIPVVYRALCEAGAPEVPCQTMGRLRRAYVTNAAHNLRLTGELLRLLSLLEAEGIEAAPFKGPVLAGLLFQNVALRQFGDLDILIRQKDVRRARQLLLADGYKPEFTLSARSEAEYIRSEHAFQFQKEAQGFVIELHWRFGSRNQAFPVDSEEVRGRLESASFQGREIRTLAREDLLIYLCAHGAKHGWDRLEWIYCVAALLRGEAGLRWDLVQRRAIESGAQRTLHIGLLLAGELAPVPAPAAILTEMHADAAAMALARQACENLFNAEPDHSRREVYRQTFYLRARERWSDRARILLYSTARVPHPLAKDWHLFRIPASMSFLYYLLRPLRLMRDYGFRRLRAMLRPGTTC